ncbi:MAG: hypothetical protein JXA13_16410 [Anaerolineales bacterium]|nr:hypothetical protein [Anaerolineales bacterium]
MSSNRVLLLSGSHRGKKTTTNSLLAYVDKRLSAYNIQVFREQVPRVIPNEESIFRIYEGLQKCDTFILCFPLYFDTLPYPLISALELLSNQGDGYKRIKMLTIVHCGLPEAAHSKNALAVCRNFSDAMGFEYLGSVILPDTGAIDGAPVENMHRIRSILDQGIALLTGPGIMDREVTLIGRPSMQPFFFRVFGNMIMQHFARKNKVSVFQKGYDQL